MVQPIHFIGNKELQDKLITINNHFDQALTKKLIKVLVSLILL